MQKHLIQTNYKQTKKQLITFSFRNLNPLQYQQQYKLHHLKNNLNYFIDLECKHNKVEWLLRFKDSDKNQVDIAKGRA